MTEDETTKRPPGGTGDEELDQRLDETAEELRTPHHDDEERHARQEAARRAGRSPRREGEGIHEGSH